MNIHEALAQLGVGNDTLTQAEKDTLDRDGVFFLHGILSADEVEQFRTRPDELLAEEGDQAGSEVHAEPGTERLSDLAQRRRAMHSYFCRRDQPQQLDQKKYLRKETGSRLSDAARCVLDVVQFPLTRSRCPGVRLKLRIALRGDIQG